MDLIERFEQCTLPIAEMHHTQHLEIALWYVLHYPPEEALERMRNGLKALLAENGVGSSYNEEVTLGWMTFVQEFTPMLTVSAFPRPGSSTCSLCGRS